MNGSPQTYQRIATDEGSLDLFSVAGMALRVWLIATRTRLAGNHGLSIIAPDHV